MSYNKNSILARATQLNKFKTETVYTEVSAPSSSTNFTASFKSNSAPKYGTTNEFIINALPDFTPILEEIIYHVIQDSTQIDARNHPKVSNMTYTSYCLSLVYAHFLAHDCYINPSTSRHALEIKNDTALEDYLKYLLSRPVPAFLETIIMNFRATTTANRTNVWFTPSFRGYTHYTHFGRVFPVNIFTALHDYAASTTSRIDPAQAHLDISLIPIFGITDFKDTNSAATVAATPAVYHISNFFASCYPSTDLTARRPVNRYLGSKLNQVFSGLFNPVLLRSQQQRTSFSTLALREPTFPTANYNPYILLLNMLPENIDELRTLYDTVSATLVSAKIASKELCTVIASESTGSIMNHGYSVFPLPHWDADNNIANTTDAEFTAGNKIVKFDPIIDDTYADLIQFKSPLPALDAPAATWNTRTHSVGNINVRPSTTEADPDAYLTPVTVTVTFTPAQQPSATQRLAYIQQATTGRHDTHFNIPVDAAAPTTGTPPAAQMANSVIATYNTEVDHHPTVKVLQVPAFDEETAYQVALHGMVVLSDELSASAVPHAHYRSRVEEDNAQFLSSAIPFSLTHLATSFKTHNPIACRVVRPPLIDSTSQVSTSLIRNPVTVFNIQHAQFTFDFGFQSLSPGLTDATNVSVPTYAQTFLGFNTPTRNNPRNRARTLPSATPTRHLLVWSPYTFVNASAEHDWDNTNIEEALNARSFLTNLRTIFGTDITLGEIRNAQAAMPVA